MGLIDLVYYISLWYHQKEQAIRLNYFWPLSVLAGAFGSLTAYAIAQIHHSTVDTRTSHEHSFLSLQVFHYTS
ncbi:unnamed protein product [Adineta ricciae]|uniref:Uncharacterized protein n=1 Tax=Adineta ricciae TaxID=249248 RepID=A0A814NWL2_ADIRI|nr:unnamed protein product [Adineta ricciae]CAF1096816.1 unnamed protein product [Adineta ricciae]